MVVEVVVLVSTKHKSFVNEPQDASMNCSSCNSASKSDIMSKAAKQLHDLTVVEVVCVTVEVEAVV